MDIMFYHEGTFVEKNGELNYDGGDIYVATNDDTEFIGYWDIKDVFKNELKYKNVPKHSLSRVLRRVCL